MKKIYYSVLCLPFFMSITTDSALSAENAASPTMMDEVLVTASRTEESVKSVSANATLISREEIQQSAVKNIGDLLADRAIGNVKKYPGNLTSVAIRGFSTDTHGNDLQGHVLVLLDGRRAGTGNLAKIMTANVERVEIIRGPGAVQYGSAGMGGVINIITRRGANNSLFAEVKGGSFDTVEGSVGGTALAGGFDFAGSYSYGSRGDYKTGSGGRYHNTGIDAESGLSANLGYSFSNSRVGLTVTGFSADDAGNPGYRSQNDLDNSSDKENYSADLNFEGQCPVTGSKVLARYFFGKDENTWLNPTASNPSGWDDGTESKNTTDQQGAQIQVSNAFGPVNFTTGFDWLEYKVENSWAPQQTDYSNPAVFLLTRSSLLDDKFSVNIGLRYDWYELQVTEPAGRKSDDSHFTPQIGFAWMVVDDLKVRAQYGEAFMMPSANQMAADSVTFGTRVVGNSDLAPETSRTWEGGIDYSSNGFDVALTYFYTDFEDKIVTADLADGSKSWKNMGDATISGFEAALAYDIGAPLNLAWEIKPYLNMTFLDTYEDDSTGEDLQYISDTNLSAGISISNADDIFCRLNVSHSGSQDITDYEYGSYSNIKLPSSTVTSLTGSWRVYENERSGSFTLRGEITNLFDEDYAYVQGYPMPGIGFSLALRWDY